MRFIARNLSRLFFLVIYVFDICLAYLTGGWQLAFIAIFGIILILEIEFGIALLMLRAHYLKKSRPSDSALLKQCMNEVMAMYGKKHKIKLYISDENSMNVHTVGYSIVVDRGLLATSDTTMIKALLAHNISHVLYSNCAFSALLQLNLFGVVLFIGISLFGASIIFAGMIFIACWCAWSFWGGCFFGKHIKNILCKISSFLVKALFFISKIVCLLFTMLQEFEADNFAVSLGYGNSLRDYLEYTANNTMRCPAECILGIYHPSNERRIVKIERAKNNYYSQAGSTQNNGLFI